MRFETDVDGGVRVVYVYVWRVRVAVYRSNDDYRSFCIEVAVA